MENRTIAVLTATGATLTSSNVIKVLEERNMRQIEEQEQWRQNQILREQRAIEKIVQQQAAMQRWEKRSQPAEERAKRGRR